MSMSAAQNAAFQAASGVPSSTSNTLWLSLTMACVTLWLIWLLMSLYKGWANGNLKAEAAGGSAIKGLLLYVVLSWLILH